MLDRAITSLAPAAEATGALWGRLMATTVEGRKRIGRTPAIKAARALIDALDGCYDDIRVAGSLRRGATLVGDVEIVAVPKLAPVTDLLGEQTGAVDLLHVRLNELAADGVAAPRRMADGSIRWGPRVKYLTFGGVPIDLFCCEAERLGWILTIRTGPAAFSRQLVVERGKTTKDGRPGLLPASVKPRDGWLTHRVSGERIPTPSEAEVFAVLGIPFREPFERR